MSSTADWPRRRAEILNQWHQLLDNLAQVALDGLAALEAPEACPVLVLLDAHEAHLAPELRRAGARVRLKPKVFDLLALLVEEHPRLLSKDELMAEMKAAGVEYEERMERLAQVEHPKPNREWIYASFDADSGGEEGAYYVWTPEQLTEVLGAGDKQFNLALLQLRLLPQTVE